MRYVLFLPGYLPQSPVHLSILIVHLLVEVHLVEVGQDAWDMAQDPVLDVLGLLVLGGQLVLPEVHIARVPPAVHQSEQILSPPLVVSRELILGGGNWLQLTRTPGHFWQIEQLVINVLQILTPTLRSWPRSRC